MLATQRVMLCMVWSATDDSQFVQVMFGLVPAVVSLESLLSDPSLKSVFTPV